MKGTPKKVRVTYYLFNKRNSQATFSNCFYLKRAHYIQKCMAYRQLHLDYTENSVNAKLLGMKTNSYIQWNVNIDFFFANGSKIGPHHSCFSSK